MEEIWKPTVAGILNIISGAFGIIGGIFLVSDSIPFTLSFFVVLGIPLIVLGALAIMGGIYALQRKMWGLALAGSISATLFSPIMGIAAIIFTALSRRQFQ